MKDFLPMDCRLLFPPSLSDQTPPAAACSTSILRERNTLDRDKENITFGRENSVTMDDDRKQMPEGAHQTAQMPSAVPFPPPLLPNRNDNISRLAWVSSKDKPMQQNSEKRRGELSMAASTHDSPPKLPFHHVPHANTEEIRRPITLRPSSQDPRTSLLNPPALRFGHHQAPGSGQERSFPSLELALDEGTDVLQNLPSAATSRQVFPQLRIRPIASNKEVKMSSPLVRRGAAERAYLQRQLKAEALRRRKQEEHNDQRKLRWNANTTPVDGFKDDNKSDGDILSMIEKFKFGFEGIGGGQNKVKPLPKNSRRDLRDFAASPPAFLKKTFKRSVSAVLADSGIDEDRNSLFFPDGVPLLRVEDEGPLNEVADGTSIDSDSRDSSHGRCSLRKVDDNSVDTPESGSISQDSTSSDELSPSLIAADVIWQLGAFDYDDVPSELSMPTNKGTTKVTLRPKMNAPENNFTSALHPDRQFKPIDGCNSSNCISLDARSKSVDQANARIRGDDLTSDEDTNPFKFETPDKFYHVRGAILAASESFQQLSFENDDKMENNDRAHSDKSCYTHEGIIDKKHPFTFSSPEAGFNSQIMFKGKVSMAAKGGTSDISPGPPSDLSESNYWTPDNSEHRRYSRKQLGKMPKLPELSMPDMIDSDSQIKFQRTASLALDASVEEEDLFSPEVVANGLLLKEPLSESNFTTPENSFNDRRSFRKHLGERMPKLPELSLPRMVDSSAQPQNEDQVRLVAGFKD